MSECHPLFNSSCHLPKVQLKVCNLKSTKNWNFDVLTKEKKKRNCDCGTNVDWWEAKATTPLPVWKTISSCLIFDKFGLWDLFTFGNLLADPTPEFKALMMFFMGLLTKESVSGYGRDAVIDMIIKFVPKKEGIGRALTFVTNGGQYHQLDRGPFGYLYPFISLVVCNITICPYWIFSKVAAQIMPLV